MSESIEIRSARGANLAMTALMLGTGGPVFALGVWRLVESRSELASLLMAPVGLFLLVAGGLALRNALRLPVQVRMDAAGITDRRVSQGQVPWDRIREAELITGKRNRLEVRLEFPLGEGRLIVDLLPLEEGPSRMAEGLRRFAPQIPRIGF